MSFSQQNKKHDYNGTKTLKETIEVKAGEVFDGNWKRYKADPNRLGSGSQSENQKPLFKVHSGGRIKNVIIDKPAADGIWVYSEDLNKPTYVEKVEFRDVGEDAITVKSGNNNHKVFIKKCKFWKAEDKVIQINSRPRVYVKDCYFNNFQRAVRTSGKHGNQSYRVKLERCWFEKGKTVLKMSNKKARAELVDCKFKDIKHKTRTSNGAKAKIV